MQVFDLVLKNEERRCYFARGGKVTKTPPGDGFVSTFAQRVLTVTHPTPSGLRPSPPDRGSRPPGPLFYGGRIPVFLGTFVRRAKSEWRLLLFPAHWGLVRSKFAECYILLHAASLGKARADGLLSRADETSAPTKRLPVLCVGAGVSPARRLLPRPHRNNAPPF